MRRTKINFKVLWIVAFLIMMSLTNGFFAKAQASNGYFPRVKGCVVWSVFGMGNASQDHQEASIAFRLGGGSKVKCESGNQDNCAEESCKSNN